MRVLLVTDWPGIGGGVETYLTLLARGLRRAGDEVALVTSGVGGGAAVADYVAFGAHHPVLQSVLQVANPAASRTIRRARAEFKPDVALVSMFEMHLSPSVLFALGDTPTVMSINYYKPICPNGLKLLPDDSHCTELQGVICWRGGCFSLTHWLRDRPRYSRIRTGLARAAATITCSRWLQGVLAYAGVTARWAPWPVEAPSPGFRREITREPMFVFTGRLAREKGVESLLHALRQVHNDGIAARLRIVGDGPLQPSLELLTAQLGLNDAVEFTGWLPMERVEAQLVDAWALVAPSLWAEPLGFTALEAIVRGIPVIASEVGGLAETVEHGVSGLLFPNGDAQALAASLAGIASGRALAGGVPDAIVAGVRAAHDLGRHVAWLRGLFEEVAT